jgi:hypothetical protein
MRNIKGKYNAQGVEDELGNKYRSKLELYCRNKLVENGIDYEYESMSFILLDDFYHEFNAWEVKKLKGLKVYSNLSKKINKIKYIPDFIGSNWIIETKGLRTPEFNIKWKLFKAYLVANNLHYELFLPTNQKEIDLSIQIIKQEK